MITGLFSFFGVTTYDDKSSFDFDIVGEQSDKMTRLPPTQMQMTMNTDAVCLQTTTDVEQVVNNVDSFAVTSENTPSDSKLEQTTVSQPIKIPSSPDSSGQGVSVAKSQQITSVVSPESTPPAVLPPIPIQMSEESVDESLENLLVGAQKECINKALKCIKANELERIFASNKAEMFKLFREYVENAFKTLPTTSSTDDAKELALCICIKTVKIIQNIYVQEKLNRANCISYWFSVLNDPLKSYRRTAALKKCFQLEYADRTHYFLLFIPTDNQKKVVKVMLKDGIRYEDVALLPDNLAATGQCTELEHLMLIVDGKLQGHINSRLLKQIENLRTTLVELATLLKGVDPLKTSSLLAEGEIVSFLKGNCLNIKDLQNTAEAMRVAISQIESDVKIIDTSTIDEIVTSKEKLKCIEDFISRAKQYFNKRIELCKSKLEALKAEFSESCPGPSSMGETIESKLELIESSIKETDFDKIEEIAASCSAVTQSLTEAERSIEDESKRRDNKLLKLEKEIQELNKLLSFDGDKLALLVKDKKEIEQIEEKRKKNVEGLREKLATFKKRAEELSSKVEEIKKENDKAVACVNEFKKCCDDLSDKISKVVAKVVEGLTDDSDKFRDLSKYDIIKIQALVEVIKHLKNKQSGTGYEDICVTNKIKRIQDWLNNFIRKSNTTSDLDILEILSQREGFELPFIGWIPVISQIVNWFLSLVQTHETALYNHALKESAEKFNKNINEDLVKYVLCLTPEQIAEKKAIITTLIRACNEKCESINSVIEYIKKLMENNHLHVRQKTQLKLINGKFEKILTSFKTLSEKFNNLTINDFVFIQSELVGEFNALTPELNAAVDMLSLFINDVNKKERSMVESHVEEGNHMGGLTI